MSDEQRAAKGLLTTTTLARLVGECLGTAPVLAIVGNSRTGKTWATKDWVASRDNALEHVAYVDCKDMGFGLTGTVAFDGVESDLREKHYPRFALDGIDVVVVDEPGVNRELVRELLVRTAPKAGAAAHRLIVLLIQDTRVLNQVGIGARNARCYSTAGLPIMLAKE